MGIFKKSMKRVGAKFIHDCLRSHAGLLEKGTKLTLKYSDVALGDVPLGNFTITITHEEG